MMTVSQIVNQLQRQRARTQQELEKLDGAIAALVGVGREAVDRVPRTRGSKRRGKMPAATRRKLAEAQRRHWAKIRRGKVG